MKINTNKQQREIIDGVAYTVIKFRHSVLTSQKDGDIIIPSSCKAILKAVFPGIGANMMN